MKKQNFFNAFQRKESIISSSENEMDYEYKAALNIPTELSPSFLTKI